MESTETMAIAQVRNGEGLNQVRKKKKPLLYGPIRKKAPFRLTSQKKNTLWSDQLEKGITFGGQMRKRQPLRVNQSEDVLG